MAELIFTQGDPRPYVLLEHQPTRIGRAPDNSIVLQGENVSGHHAEIVPRDGSYFVRDLGSSNGTRVNGGWITEALLKHEDRIGFASTECVFREVEPTREIDAAESARERCDPILDPAKVAGTFVNGEWIAEAELKNEDRVVFASTECVFREVEPTREIDAARPTLKRCGPLLDPVKVAGTFTYWIFAVMVAFWFFSGTAFVLASIGTSRDTPQLNWQFALLALGLFLYLAAIPAAFLLLFVNETNRKLELSLFLRAFLSDQRPDKLRAWLKAALGPQFRVVGIRAPHLRASSARTILSPVLTGFYYLGSPQFELVAPDHNWMARLLATFSEARLVFLDARHLTPNVLDEVHLAWNSFGAQRCVFIIDDSISTEQWRQRISEILGQIGGNICLHTVTWPTDESPESSEFVDSVQRVLASTPTGAIQVPAKAVSFAFSKVGAHNWDTNWSEKAWGVVALHLVGSCILLLIANVCFTNTGFLLSLVPFIGCVIYFWIAWVRVWRQRKLSRRINPGCVFPSARFRTAAGLMGCGMATVVTGWVAASINFSRVLDKGVETIAQSSARLIALDCQAYALNHDDTFPKTLDELGLEYHLDRRCLANPFPSRSVSVWSLLLPKFRWEARQPSEAEGKAGEGEGWEYFGGRTTDPPDKVLFVSKELSRGNRRVFAYINLKVELKESTKEDLQRIIESNRTEEIRKKLESQEGYQR